MALLDSNIIIYAHVKGYEFLNTWLRAPDTRVSAISIPEVLGFHKLEPEDEVLFEEWFTMIPIIDASRVILRRAATLRQQQRMALSDAIIAATALEHGLALVTRNVDDFKRVPALNFINPFDA